MVINWVDVGAAIAMLIGMSVGLSQGLVKQFVFLIAAYFSIVIAAQTYDVVASWFGAIFTTSDPFVLSLAALGMVFGVVCAVLSVLARSFYKRSGRSRAGFVDHLGGAMIGAFSTWIIISIIVALLSFSLSLHWVGWENLQQDVAFNIDTSILKPSIKATLPLVAEAIRLWLPSGLPAMLSM